MKAAFIEKLVLVLLITGCAPKTTPPSSSPANPPQVDNVQEPSQPEAAATIEEEPASGSRGEGLGGGEGTRWVEEPVSREEADAIYSAAMAAVAEKKPVREELTVDGKQVVMYRWEDPRLIISENVCAPGGKLGSCQALDGVRDIPTKRVEVGPGTPAAYYCKPVGAENVHATSADGESGLCRFPDGSLVADWSLVYVPSFGKKRVAKQP